MSRFVIALLFFLSLGSLTVKFIAPVKERNNLADTQEKTWTEWALADFDQQKNKLAEIIIIGSSLVLTPVNLADAHFHNCTMDGALHHKSDLLSFFMNRQSEKKEKNFNFALPGLMPSDAYLITKLLLAGKDHPKLLIYGVGPRDFVDNLLASPASTDPYRCLSKYLSAYNEKETLALYKGKDWQSRLDYFLTEHFPVYNQRNKILTLFTEQGQSLYAQASPIIGASNDISTINKFTIANIHNLLPAYNPMAIGVNQCLFQPEVSLDPNRFAQNLNEYRQRYHRINWDTFTCQSGFFIDTLKIARDNHIKVLVVAMPITSINRELLPKHIFDLYKNNLRVFSKLLGANFLDLDETNCFNDQDFGDTVHLSTAGSVKMIKLISDYMGEHVLVGDNPSYQKRLAGMGLKL